MHLGEWIIDINYYKICAKNNFSSPEIIGGDAVLHGLDATVCFKKYDRWQ